MLTLLSITFKNAPRAPGIRPGDMSSIDCDNPTGPLQGWKARVQGPSLFLISPPGWKTGKKPGEWDPKGPSQIIEVARGECYFTWSGTEADLENITKTKFETPPFGPPLVVKPPKGGLLAQLDASQIGDP